MAGSGSVRQPTRGVQRGSPPLAGGLEGVPPEFYYSAPFLPGRGLGGWCEEAATPRRHCEEPATWQSGVGFGPLAVVWGCPPAHKGRPEGIAPSGRSSGGCPSRALLICPLPTRKGARGMVRRGRHPASSLRGACDVAIWGGVPPFGSGLGVSASAQGASRGDRPLWQEVWRVSLQSFTNLPPSYQEGGKGEGSLLPTGSAAACRCSPGLGAPGAPRLPAIAGTR